MKGKMVFGALALSVALCSQGFGLDLSNNLTGLNGGNCAPCQASAAPGACGTVKACCPEPACAPACGPCCKRDLFAGIKGLFACNRCCKADCGGSCAPCAPACPKPCAVACEKPCAPACAPACGPVCKVRKVIKCEAPCAPCAPACEKACAPACEPACGACCKPRCKRLGNGLVVDCLKEIFCIPKKALCKVACKVKTRCACGGCGTCGGCGEVGCGCGVPGAPAAPAAPAGKADAAPAPLPVAPKADPSASTTPSRTIFQASRSIVLN